MHGACQPTLTATGIPLYTPLYTRPCEPLPSSGPSTRPGTGQPVGLMPRGTSDALAGFAFSTRVHHTSTADDDTEVLLRLPLYDALCASVLLLL